MLSGTPVTNRANDMFAYFRMIKHPLGESYSAFMNMYTNTKMGRVTGSKNMTLLHKRMSNFMIRKTEKECLDLPGISYTRMFFEIGDYKNEYEQAIKDAIANKKGKKLNVDGSIHSINNIMAQAKVPGLIKQIDEMIETSGKVVVFFTYSKPIAMMAEYYGDKCVVVDGSIDGEEKIARAEKFQNDPSINVFIGNMKAAGHTIDLTSAKVCVIGNFPLSPADILQAIRRLYRIGQKDAVKVYFALCIGDRNETTVDIRLADLIEDKIEDINMIVDGGQDVIDITNVTDVLASEFLNVKDNDNAEEGSEEPDSQNP
jgi:SNF2 family DNA or RNA helicase